MTATRLIRVLLVLTLPMLVVLAQPAARPGTAVLGSSAASAAAASAIDPLVQQQKLAPSDRAPYDYFGRSVALSADGSTALVVTIGDPNRTAAAYVFTRRGSTWSQQQKLTARDGAPMDEFGSPVALSADGSTALIAAQNKNNYTGAAYVFTRRGSTWSQQKLTASDGASGDGFGSPVALSGDGSTALIAASGKNDLTGATYVFTRRGSAWSQQQKLTASDGATGDYFGYSMAFSADGSTALIGASYKNNWAGATYVFTRRGSAWSQQQKLTASDRASGDHFGSPMALSADGSTALVGAWGKNNGTGAAYVFAAAPLVPFLPAGSFVLGDLSATPGATVTWWGSFWPELNNLSGGRAPKAFKGFASTLSATPPTCGGTWTTDPGYAGLTSGAPRPPKTVPSSMAVIVSSAITRSGALIHGDIREVVIVQTNPGYQPDPGHAGTGRVVAVVCQSHPAALH